MAAGAPDPADLREAEPSGADELRAHALELAARLLGERVAVEATDEPLSHGAEAVSLLGEGDDLASLRSRLERVRGAAEAGIPAIVYVPNRAVEPSGAGIAPEELRRAFDGLSEVIFLEQRGVECSIAGFGQGSPVEASAADGAVGPPRRMLVVANLPGPAGSEARLAWGAGMGERRRELELRIAELRARNVELARERTAGPLDDSARARARLAERRLLFDRVRETVGALLARRRLRG